MNKKMGWCASPPLFRSARRRLAESGAAASKRYLMEADAGLPETRST